MMTPMHPDFIRYSVPAAPTTEEREALRILRLNRPTMARSSIPLASVIQQKLGRIRLHCRALHPASKLALLDTPSIDDRLK